MKIIVYVKSVYGATRLYVAGDPAAAISKLTGRATVTSGDITALESLGHKVEIFDAEAAALAALPKYQTGGTRHANE